MSYTNLSLDKNDRSRPASSRTVASRICSNPLLHILPPHKPRRCQDSRDSHTKEAKTDDVRYAICRPKYSTVDERPSYAAKLSHSIRQPDSNTGSRGPFECANAFWPDDWVCRSCTSGGYHQGDVFDNRTWDSNQDDVANDYRAFDYFCF